MPGTRRKYDREFGEGAVRVAGDPGINRGTVRVAGDLGINRGTLGSGVDRDRIERGEKERFHGR